MKMTEKENQIVQDAIAYAKTHRNEIARRLTDPAIFVAEEQPVSVFMAGSPGAGKTEASIELLVALAENGLKVLRIDPDELRELIPGYMGANSWLF